MQWEMIGILAGDHIRQQPGTHKALVDRLKRLGRFNNPARILAAAFALAILDRHVLGHNDRCWPVVQLLRNRLAYARPLAVASRANPLFRRDIVNDPLALKMLGWPAAAMARLAPAHNDRVLGILGSLACLDVRIRLRCRGKYVRLLVQALTARAVALAQEPLHPATKHVAFRHDRPQQTLQQANILGQSLGNLGQLRQGGHN